MKEKYRLQKMRKKQMNWSVKGKEFEERKSEYEKN